MGAEAVLVWHGMQAAFRCGAKCCASTRPTSVTNYERSRATVGLWDRDEASDPETFKRNGGGCCVGEPVGGAMQQARVLLVVQENAEMLIGRAGGASGSASSGGPQAVEERLLGEGARLVREEECCFGELRVSFQGREVQRRCRRCRGLVVLQ